MKVFDHKSGKYLPIDDAKIYYEEIGDKAAPVLLMLHGGLNNIELFNPILEKLSEQFRVIGIDSRGHGRSSLGSLELTYALLQKDVEKILEHLNIHELSILGFSNGGTIALRLGAFSNLKINAIAAVGTPWSTPHIKHVMPMFAALTMEDWKKQCPDDYAAYQRLSPDANIEQTFKQITKLALDESDKGRPNESVKNINCEVLAMRGENDPIVSEESLVELCKLIKNAKRLNIPSAGHDVITEKPKEVADILLDFFKAAKCELKNSTTPLI